MILRQTHMANQMVARYSNQQMQNDEQIPT
jgi:hypothetical protein